MLDNSAINSGRTSLGASTPLSNGQGDLRQVQDQKQEHDPERHLLEYGEGSRLLVLGARTWATPQCTPREHGEGKPNQEQGPDHDRGLSLDACLGQRAALARAKCLASEVKQHEAREARAGITVASRKQALEGGGSASTEPASAHHLFTDTRVAYAKGLSLLPALSTAALARLTLLVLFTGGCGPARGEAGRPEATLSANGDAQAAFRVLRAAWFSGSSSERRKLEAELRMFLVRFPRDEQSDTVRVLIAFDCVSRGSLQEARVFLASVREQVGAVHDFARVAEAYALLREGKPEDGWSALEPLAGKIVDPDERLVFSELRLRVAVDAHRFTRAVSAAEGAFG